MCNLARAEVVSVFEAGKRVSVAELDWRVCRADWRDNADSRMTYDTNRIIHKVGFPWLAEKFRGDLPGHQNAASASFE